MGDHEAPAGDHEAPTATHAQTGAGQGDTGPSPALLAAQARLLALRAERGIVPTATDRGDLTGLARPVRSGDDGSGDDGPRDDWHLRNANAALQQRRAELGLAPAAPSPAPSALAALIATAQAHLTDPQPPVPDPQPPTPSSHIPAHPSLLLAMLRGRHEAAGRVWLLLRAIDVDGSGRLTVDEARARLAGKDSPWRCCGARRLRQLLAEGEGLFWQRDGRGRLWLRGAHRVAADLGVERATGFPVELPVAALLGGIQGVRAAFYAAFHSGRESKPISRDTLQTLTGLAPRTQLDYDRLARVGRRRNLALGDRHSPAALQERAWQRGRAVFTFVDVRGRQGRPGGEYVAWHLPNSYEGPHTRRSRGSRKRLNRKLKDLVTKGIPGNAEGRVERVFWPDGAAAAKGFNRSPENDAYWAGPTPGRDHARFWQVIAGLER
jgi:hypothetical protein